jgi:hypothetical protein
VPFVLDFSSSPSVGLGATSAALGSAVAVTASVVATRSTTSLVGMLQAVAANTAHKARNLMLNYEPKILFDKFPYLYSSRITYDAG